MVASVKVLLLCALCIVVLTKVDGRKSNILRRNVENDEEDKIKTDGRGIISDIIYGLRPSNTAQAPVNIPAPGFFPEQALAPTFQVPSDVQTVTNRPSLLGGLLNVFNSREHVDQNPFNKNWLNFALQKCSLVDPKSLTAILPTTANGLRIPKMYYFQNDTSGALTWFKAQEWCTSKGMTLLTVNDANENKVLIDRLRLIMAGSTPTTALAPSLNLNAFWIGLNGFTTVTSPSPPTWVGDGTSTFTDLFAGEPASPAVNWCGTYEQFNTVDNIHMDGRECLPIAATSRLRYICEVSDVCMALFMSRYPTTLFHHHNDGHHGHIHYSPGGVITGK